MSLPVTPPAEVTPKADAPAAPVTPPVSTPDPVVAPPKVEEKVEAPAPTEPKTEPKVEEKAPDAKPPVVPEKYDLKLPDGSLLHASHVEKIASDAKALGLSQEQAQGMLTRESQLRASFIEDAKAELETKSTAWVEEIKADKELGGAEFERTAEMSKRFIDRFADEETKKTLNETRFGNHPGLVRMIARAAKLMSEDTMVIPGAQVSTAKKSAAEILYGSTPAAKE